MKAKKYDYIKELMRCSKDFFNKKIKIINLIYLNDCMI